MKKSIEQQLRAALPPFIPVTFSPSYVTAHVSGWTLIQSIEHMTLFGIEKFVAEIKAHIEVDETEILPYINSLMFVDFDKSTISVDPYRKEFLDMLKRHIDMIYYFFSNFKRFSPGPIEKFISLIIASNKHEECLQYIPEMIALLNYRYLGKEEYDVEVHGILLELFSVLDKECNKTVPEILQVEYPTFELKDFANCIVYGG